jgi:flagellar capping protein FliD
MTYFDGSSVKVIPDLEQTFFPDSGYTAPAVGDPVYISADNKVSLCTTANPAFIGFVQSIAQGGNKALNVYTFGHRLRVKNTSGVTLNAGDIVTSGNAGITKLAPIAHGDIETAAAADTTKIATAINAQMNRRGVVIIGGANNATVVIIFG